MNNNLKALLTLIIYFGINNDLIRYMWLSYVITKKYTNGILIGLSFYLFMYFYKKWKI